MKKDKVKKYLKELLIIISGNLLLAVCCSFFFISYNREYVVGIQIDDLGTIEELKTIKFDGILMGGTGGLSLILRSLFFLGDSGSLTVEIIITVITWILFFLGWIFLGKKFALQTLISTIIYPIFIISLKAPIFDGIRQQICQFDPVVCSIVGGVGMGTGCGIIYRIGGSTGGFDIPGLILNKFTRIKLSYIFLFMDGLLVILALVAHYNLYQIVIGLLSVIGYSIAVELTQRIGTEAYYCDIISDKWEDINNEILKNMDRGTTIVDVVGGYTNSNRKMIKTLIAKNQYLFLLDIVKKIDPEAFMSLSRTHEVFGEGYRDITKHSNK